MNKLFFRVGKLHTNTIDVTDYKSLIMDLFAQYCDVDLDPESIKLIVNHDYGGFKSFSFVTLPDGTDVDAVVSALDEQVTPDGYELSASVAQDKPRDKKPFNKNRY
jgi:hypothetical protein